MRDAFKALCASEAQFFNDVPSELDTSNCSVETEVYFDLL